MNVMRTQGLYSPRVAARVARIKYQHFQAWSKANLIHPRKLKTGAGDETVYTYEDLLLMRLIARLREHGVRPREIRVALDTIALMSQGDTRAWMKATLYVANGVIVVVLPDMADWTPVAASRGPQKMALVFFPDLLRDLERDLVPPDRFPHVEIDPEVLGGTPVVRGTRIPTRAITEVSQAGEDPRVAYPSLTNEQVRNAEEYEGFLAAA